MTLSAQKSECSFFSTNSHEAKWRPSVSLNGHSIPYNANPKFFGVTYDRQLTFALHATIVGNKLKRQANAIRCLASTDWGYDKATLRATYIATARSMVEYAAPSWLPWVSPTTMAKLEACQRYAGRAITGQVRTTPVESVLAEANLPTIETRSTQLCTIALEKSLRRPPENPRRQIAEAAVRQRTKKQSWRTKATPIWSTVFGEATPEPTPPLLPPWLPMADCTFEILGRKSADAEFNRKMAMETLEKDWATYDAVVYTDGSATGGNTNGGGGIVVTTGHPSDPVIHRQISLPAGEWCSSFQAEEKAIKEALSVLAADQKISRARIVTDSQSVLLHLQTMSPSQPPANGDERTILELLSILSARGCHLTFTWCPSHCNVVGNELADDQAKEGTLLDQKASSWHYESAKAAIRRATRGRAFQHERMRRVYGERGEKINHHLEKGLTRQEQVTLSRLRCNHHPETKYWMAKIGRAADTVCRKCGLGEETTEHIICGCPRVHPPHLLPTKPDLLPTDPRLALEIWERWRSAPNLPDVSQPGQPQ